MIIVLRKALGPKWPNKAAAQINTSDIQDYVKWRVKTIQEVAFFITWDHNYLAQNVKC